MTREEAAKILKGAIKKPNTEDGYLGQAITMAIRSLEAWDKVLNSFKFLYQFGKIEKYTIDIIDQHLEGVEDEQVH